MAFLKNKQLYVYNDVNEEFEPFITIRDEIFLVADIAFNECFSLQGNPYYAAVHSPASTRILRVYLLNDDETINCDISEFILNDWKFDFNSTDTKRRFGSINIYNCNGQWSPSPIKNTIWKGRKFKVYIGIYFDEVIYWKDCGIFAAGNLSVDSAKQTISVPLYDKFALLDGTIGGKSMSQFRIAVGTKIKQAIELCLKPIAEDNKTTIYLDCKDILIPGNLLTKETPYTITKDENTSIGEIIEELAKMCFCDVYYNSAGNLTLTPSIVTTDDLKQTPVSYLYEEGKGEIGRISASIDFSSVINEITVAGAIENGNQYKAVIRNENPKSQFNINMTLPNSLYIEDSNLIGDETCKTRGKYEMAKQGRLYIQIKFDSIFIPHLQCNDIVNISQSDLGIANEKFIINSFSVSADGKVPMAATNINEVVF